MAYATQRTVSNGALTSLALSITYLDRSEITVYFNGVLTPSTSGLWNWVGSTSNTLNFTPAVASGVEVKVVRTTNLGTMRHVFSTGAQFTKTSMDENFSQVLQIAQEAREGATLSEVFNDLDMHTNYIHNVAAGTLPNDAVNLQQVVAITGSAVTTAQAAAAQATATYDSFDDRYLGAKSSPPTLDNDSQPLLVGALYWDTGLNSLGVRSGNGTWVYAGANTAASISSTPSGSISATNVQSALNQLDAGKNVTLGFTPVQQGTGTGQSTNAVKIGWTPVGRPALTVDVTDMGYIGCSGLANFWTNTNTFATLNCGNFTSTGSATVAGAATFSDVTARHAASGAYTQAFANASFSGINMYAPGGLKIMRVSTDNSLQYVNSTNTAIISSMSDAGAWTASSFTATSDARLKRNWRAVKCNFVQRLSRVKSGVYDRIDTGETSAGVSAQSLRRLLPEAVGEGTNGYLGVNYGALSSVAVVELAKAVVALTERIASLEAK